MAENRDKITAGLEDELKAARKVIESLKRHQKAGRTSIFESPGAFENMIRLEGLIGKRTSELIKSREDLEKIVVERTKELSDANRELNVVSEIVKTVSTSLDLKQILNDAMLKVLEITGLKGGGYFLVDPDRGELISAGGWNLSEEFSSSTQTQKIGTGISGTVAATGNTVIVENLQNSKYISKEMKVVNLRENIGGQISIPLKRKDRVIGVMNLVSAEGQEINAADISMLEAVGNQIGVAVENAALYEQTSQRLNELQALSKTITNLSSNLELAPLIDSIAEQAVIVFKTDAAAIMLMDETETRLIIRAARGLSKHYIKKQEIALSLAQQVLESNEYQPLYTPELFKTPFGDGELIKKEKIYSNLATPLIKDKKLIGILNLYSKNKVRKFSAHEKSLSKTFADQVSIAIENANRYQREVRGIEELKSLYEIGQSIVSSLDLDQTLEFIVDSMVDLFPSFSTAIMLLDESGQNLTVRAGKGCNYENRKNSIIPLGKGITGYVAKTGKVEIVPDVSKYPGYLKGLDEVKSEICAPLIHKGKIIGVIDIECDILDAFDNSHKELLLSLANLAAIAIENARTYEESENRAAHLNAVRKLGSDLSKILHVNELAQKVVNELGKVIEADDCRFYMIDDKNEELIPLAHWAKIPDYKLDDIDVLKLKIGEGITGDIAKTGIAEVIPDATKHPLGVTIPGTVDEDESMLVVPMKFENEVKGVISLSKLGLNQFTSGHLRLLTIFADQAAIALENARLYEEKMAQIEEIEQLSDFNEAIVEGLAEGIVIENSDGMLTFVNPKMEEITGYSNEELIKMHYKDLIAPSYHKITEQQFKIISSGASSKFESAVIDKNGEEIPVFISARPVFSAENLVNILVAITDISDLKKMEMQMVRNARLRALGEMSGGVAHDFNNVLGAIYGRVELLIMNEKNPQTLQGLNIIRKAAKDGAETVKRIQNFTRTRTDERFIPVDVNEIVDDAISITRSRWKEEPDAAGYIINVERKLSELPETAGNPGELREVLTNLIFNAVDAMPDGGRIVLSTRVINGNIVIEVEDDGAGIDEKVIDKIFDPFFSTKGVKGTGLGLSVSYGIISRHQGEIFVESKKGGGSSFKIVLPIIMVENTDQTQTDTHSQTGVKLKIVVIDDESVLRNLLADILTLDSHEVHTAANGKDGLEIIDEIDPQVVFTDLGMPGMSGWEVIKTVNEKYPGKPIVMVTGWGDQIDKVKLKESDVYTVIAKPFEIYQLRETLNKIIVEYEL